MTRTITMMNAHLFAVILSTALLGFGCGAGGRDGEGLLGGDGGVFGDGGLFGDDTEPYDEPQITVISSSTISPDGTVVIKALVDEEETPLVNWVVRFTMQCETGPCPTNNHIERGEFGEGEPREISFRRTFAGTGSPEVTFGAVDIEVSYLVKPNDERQARIQHSYNIAKDPLRNQPDTVVIDSSDDFEDLPLDADGTLEGDVLIWRRWPRGSHGFDRSAPYHRLANHSLQSGPDLARWNASVGIDRRQVRDQPQLEPRSARVIR